MRWTHRLLLETPCPCWRNGGLPSSTVHTQAHTATCWLPAATVPCHRVHPRMGKLLPWDTQSCMLNLTLGSWACLLPLKRFREIEPVHSLSRGDPLSPRFWEFLLAIFSSLYAKPFLLCSVCYNAPLWGFSSFMVTVPTMCGLPPRVH